MKTVHIKRDDTVIVISGDDKGKKGKVLTVSPEEKKVIVEDIRSFGTYECTVKVYTGISAKVFIVVGE